MVQLRVSPTHHGRLPAGAPSPIRGLTANEVERNLSFFLHERAGPRTPACTRVIVSGELAQRGELVPAVQSGIGASKAGVVLHGGSNGAILDGLGWTPLAELAVLWGDQEFVPPALCPWHAVLSLTHAGITRLEWHVTRLIRLAPQRVTLSWPFPGKESPAPMNESVIASIASAVTDLEQNGIAVGVKGLPPCALRALQGRRIWSGPFWRSRNRWYVDAEHQLQQALLFFPHIVQLEKRDSCRFCAETLRCDGAAAQWLTEELIVLEPLGRHEQAGNA